MNICKPFGSRPPWWKATFPPLVRSLKYTWKFNRETLRKSIHGKSVTCFTISWYHFENWAIPAGHVVSDKAALCQYVQWNFVELFRSVWFGPFDETVLCDFLIGWSHRGSTNEKATSWSMDEECQISNAETKNMRNATRVMKRFITTLNVRYFQILAEMLPDGQIGEKRPELERRHKSEFCIW